LSLRYLLVLFTRAFQDVFNNHFKGPHDISSSHYSQSRSQLGHVTWRGPVVSD
jgi:hypothetical protein